MEVCQRFDGQAMASYSAVAATSQPARSPTDRSQENCECHPVRSPDWMPVADDPQGLSELEHGLRGILEVAERRNMADGP